MAIAARIKKKCRTAVAAVTTVALVAAVAACGTGSGGTGASSAPTTATTATPLNELAVPADPKSLTGPSTATKVSDVIDPIAQNPTPALPATVTDAQGTKVTITDTSRILALDIYGTLAQVVYDLGLGDNVVGRDTSSTFDEIKDLPRVTENGHSLNGESILSLSPTVIITDTSLGPWDVLLQMRDAGVPVVVVDSDRTLENTGTIIKQVANALGLKQQGKELAKRTTDAIDAKIAQIKQIAPSDTVHKLRMAFLYVRGNAGVYYMFGEGSGADSLIEALGGYDVTAETGWTGMRPITDEGLVAAQPDLVLTMSGGLEATGGVDGLLEAVPALAQTPAGANRRIVDMDDSQIMGFGPDSAAVLDSLARAIYAPDSAAESQ
ncbi:heme/hemin ABC transporter substrate-binding protein [Rarobacter incanus]|uniref:Iron complex transport system substrate-binding protein n=1 Tax=Rarobacter incanus TaxID=153494 RepID=A0A542SRD5_9MICO|nr:ABC transporter substrate-binding protein [Rarobacter incanus]TQK77180.1 iron complex transport system substrate-binding protein [Rarobacter incanus]